MNKYTIAGLCLSAAILSGCGNNVQENTQKVENHPGITIGYSQELSAEVVASRGNDVLVEICYGRVISKDGDGEIINPYDKDYNYISYSDYTKNGVLKEGDIVRTVLMYNVGTAPDDVFARFDWRIDKNGNSHYIGADVDEVKEIEEGN